MSPMVKYGLGRLGLFVAVLLVLLPTSFDMLIKLLLAVLVSAVLSWFVLRPWREQAADRMAQRVERRRVEREKLRATLAGGEPEQPAAPPGGSAAPPGGEAGGDR